MQVPVLASAIGPFHSQITTLSDYSLLLHLVNLTQANIKLRFLGLACKHSKHIIYGRLLAVSVGVYAGALGSWTCLSSIPRVLMYLDLSNSSITGMIPVLPCFPQPVRVRVRVRVSENDREIKCY